MKSIYFSFLFLFLISCNHTIDRSKLNDLNGYWEIEKVVLKDGTEKEYKMNETVDYIFYKDQKGFRSKVIPQFDGGFLSNKTKENFTILEEDTYTVVAYKTDFATWKEKIIKIEKDKFEVENENGITYYYKRHTLIQLDNGEKTQ
jgi:hypothetical protein